ncbi:GntR family transcriptional regulator [Pseudooceanicola sediminis]|uniref:GntR family transcriptional regulator n=1 Tax=Pseudooceanicola sediminis TaxID=2211117 RepID=A0A399J2L9_9RHOB|nr:GntR family transcriptional regulator [Pseudooceanicola sediminis]KAA2317294.1 GntR family transcriptional regulator [Puniceibacterium sp. HSS470]RII39648.1 GntR family transcriptional regulator [Pseudooceanicola sediminis]|tara:strand:+ start:27824 stop:28519 length:696 start_codon:yes stop_codon:yes gene_type:complete
MAQLDSQLNLRPIGLEVADRMQAAIVREAYRPGEKLGEVEICAQFGVSRSPLREAFQILENRGLVERRPRIGTRVTEMSVQTLDEITLCRAPLEAACSGLLAALPDHARVATALEVELDAMRAAHDRGDPLAGFEANVRMTMLSHDMCGNSVLVRLLRQLDVSALRYRYRAYRQMPEMLSSMIASNAGMVAEIRAGRPDAARDITEQLVWRAWETTRQLFIDSEKTRPEND